MHVHLLLLLTFSCIPLLTLSKFYYPHSDLTIKVIFREYKLLHLLEFSSSRKRMSVVVSDEDGKIFLLCKGADRYVTRSPTSIG